jgi:hypothetical protein
LEAFHPIFISPLTYAEVSEQDFEKDSFANSEFKRLGGRGVPLLVRGEKTLTGFASSSYKRFFSQ